MRNTDEERQTEDVAEQQQEEDAAELPEREAMSLLLNPGALLGGLSPGSGSSPTTTPVAPTPAAPGSDVPTPAGNLTMPHMPVPEANPGGTYQPDTSSTSKT
jgi:hypothetical protein